MTEYSPEQAARVSAILDEALGTKKRNRNRPSADTLAGWLGDAIDRWPDHFGPGERDEVSHIIFVLNEIADQPRAGKPR